jgi:hypothetical protein
LEGAAALDFGAAALSAVGFAFLSADFFGALFLAAECFFFFRGGAALFAFFVFLVFDFVFFAMIVLPIVQHYSVRFNRVAVQPFALPAALTDRGVGNREFAPRIVVVIPAANADTSAVT